MNTSIAYRYVLEHLTSNGFPVQSIQISTNKGDCTLSFDGELTQDGLRCICDRWRKVEPNRAAIIEGLLSNFKVELMFDDEGTMRVNHTLLGDLDSRAKDCIERFIFAITFFAEQARECLLLKIVQIKCSLGSMKNSLDQFEREFKTARFLIRVSECYETEFNVDEWDREVFLNLVDSLLKHETRVYALKVALFNRDDNREIAHSTLKGCINSTRNYDLTHSGFMLKVFKKVRESAVLSA